MAGAGEVLQLLPAKVRQGIYIGWGLSTLAAGAADVWFGNADPWWLPKTVDTLVYLGIPVMAIAASNVSPSNGDVVKT